ncbi:oxygenase MpaB family protein [Deinococcus apachensis]|uniref:oxygenase MpaB family protein n=1 Tax=Deinococcus apachensis TaxID=309886 RepID=UPI0012FB4B18|nr:oxygenase MpaB family protein [Deinococcus apachensis]
MHTVEGEPPQSLVNLDVARRRFGDDAVGRLAHMVQLADPLADAADAELRLHGETARRQLRAGLLHGRQFVGEDLPAVRALLAEAERVPAWVEPRRLERGSQAYLAIGNVWITLSLGPGSLTHTYSSPSIARVLVRTGNLIRMARRRIVETGVWNIVSVLPGGLARGGEGYIQNVQVRLLHARVRAALWQRGWNAAETGAPINQLEMARTWLDFTYVPFHALQTFGITFTAGELDDLYHFWQYVAHLLGVHPDLYRDVTNQARAADLLALISQTEEPAGGDARELTQAMLVAVADLLQSSLPTPPPVTLDLVHAVARRLHGDRLADQLGIRKPWVRHALVPIMLGNRLRRWRERVQPGARDRTIDHTIRTFRGQLAGLQGETTYQRSAGPVPEAGLPRTVEPTPTSSGSAVEATA